MEDVTANSIINIKTIIYKFIQAGTCNDRLNIFYTFHYGLPSSVEALYQEAGRAGRWDKALPENKKKRGKMMSN